MGRRDHDSLDLACAVRHTAPLVLLLLALVVALGFAQAAAAAPPEPTMDLEQLSAALASGRLDGYMLTTMQGTEPVQIPVKVLAASILPVGQADPVRGLATEHRSHTAASPPA